MIVALPAILAAFLMVLTTKEPERGATEDALKVGSSCRCLLWVEKGIGKTLYLSHYMCWTPLKVIYSITKW